ncbi:fumarylacetoacetate hydrolase family protein [uncultured Microbacterium sp.]|uniref:fumarylacetoacetate hydrolase family protein n=1 Tax=uncultured Microbacterium sp. TaxID=191216 RepID=UPI0035CBE881
MAIEHWALAQYRTTDDALPRLGILRGETLHAPPSGWPLSTLALLEQWSAWTARLRDLDVGALSPIEGASLLAPITYPRKLICAGANYYAHAAEMNTARPDPTESPFFFLKPPTTTIVGPDARIEVDDLPAAGLDWEVELAVVIADRCKNLTAADAPAHIAGYTIANDLSARLLFPRENAVAAPFAFDWIKHKAFDGSCPLGPGIVPAWLVDDPHDLGIRLSVNGVTKQDSSTADMVIGVYDLIAAVSRTITLEPGDVILTGTPAGVGMPRHDFLHDGDVVAAGIHGLGRLENTIVGVW